MVFPGYRRSFRNIPVLLILLSLCVFAQQEARTAPDLLPQDSGAAGLRQMLVRLKTTARLMQTTAHPDDEDGGMLTLESRGKGATTLLFTLTRGEGGQNRMGSNLFDELGVLRTLELVASDRYYGVEQRFSHVADFGYSKNAKETFEKWKGHEAALGDMVRAIRTFRPDVLVSRFQGSSRDGHGHHEASGVLTPEAFRAAGDPTKFPEQIKEGLQPWQPKKLYIGNRGGDDYTVRLDTGAEDPALGMSYWQFAVEGLRHQLSQGAGDWRAGSGQHFTAYKLIATSAEKPADDVKEQDFFDGIDTSVTGMAKQVAAGDRNKAAFLQAPLAEIQSHIERATTAATSDPQSATQPLLAALRVTNELLAKVKVSNLSAESRKELGTKLETKREQLQEAARLASGIQTQSRIENSGSQIVVPGQRFVAIVNVHAPQGLQVSGVNIQSPEGWNVKAGEKTGEEYRFNVVVPQGASFTRPYYERDDPETDTIYRLIEPQYAGLPLPPPPLSFTVSYSSHGEEGSFTTVMQTPVKRGAQERNVPVAVGPAVSVLIEPATRVVPASQRQPAEVMVRVRSNVADLRDGTLQLHVENGWRVQPLTQAVAIEQRGGEKTFKFFLFPLDVKEGSYKLRATLNYRGQDFEQGFSVVSRDDLGTGYYYQPATQRVSVVNITPPPNLSVGYIMGAGDGIPTVLQQIGVNLKLITPEELASGDLQKYGTIVLGIRAYDAREDVRKYNQRLLDYCSKGGTLVVQYNANTGEFNSGKYTPYPATLGRDRVSVEDAPVELLDPNDDVFDFPNQISANDFNGWVQERGLYFMSNWDTRYRPLMASQDPGESPLGGGMLRAPFGKGTYVYTGYSFFRQLPHGVPGAIRLFVNLVAAGHEDGR
jgi:LmbE family N-acetylglucosaminyl deacetylase